MTTDKTAEYLDKQLLVEKSIVTFRLLSRELGLHVNEAKNELARYYSTSRDASQKIYATYFVSGEIKVTRDQGQVVEERMDVEEHEIVNGEDVVEFRAALVGESKLESCLGQLSRVFSKHIYCLSPEPIQEPELLCGPTQILRDVEAKEKLGFSDKLGRISGPHVKLQDSVLQRTTAPVTASSSRPKAPTLQKSATLNSLDNRTSIKTEGNGDKPKPKPSGKLDWSKAKPKEEKPDVKVTGNEAGKDKSKGEAALPSLAKPKEADQSTSRAAQKTHEKRGTKRKPLSESSDSDSPKLPATTLLKGNAKGGIRIKNGILFSDDDEDEPPRPKSAGKAKATKPDSDIDPDLIAMMDIDDDQVVRVARSAPKPQNQDESAEEDVEMRSEREEPDPPPIIPKPRKKEKKAWPVGKNGLKKKRVVKTRRTLDDKGYFVVEDYSSYESVDEEEPEPPMKGKGKKKTLSTKELDEGQSTTESKPKPPLKSRPRTSDADSSKGKKPGAQKKMGQGALTSWLAKS